MKITDEEITEQASDISTTQNIVDTRSFIFNRNASSKKKNGLDSLTNLRNAATTLQINPKQVIVIIITQGRSGSMFAGATLASLLGVYYSHEPVRDWFLLEKQLRHVTKNETIDFFEAMLQCRIHEFKNYIMNRQFEQQYNDVLYEYFIHAKNEYGAYGEVGDNLSNHGYFRTIHCKRSRIHLLKTIWFRMKHTLKFMSDPSKDVRIIHLLRDPRGLLNSLSPSHATKFAPELCSNVTEDLAAADIVRNKFPERYLRIMYEDLAMSPVTTFRRMLQFIGEPFTRSFQHNIERKTHIFDTESNQNAYSIEKNSKNRPYQWRRVLKFKDVLEIQNHCSDVMQQLGFRVFQSEDEYTNSSISVWSEENSSGNVAIPIS